MIPRGVEIFVGLDPIDLRWSFGRLAGIASERLGRDARCGALFVFFGKRREALKVLFSTGPGCASSTSGSIGGSSISRSPPIRPRGRCSAAGLQSRQWIVSLHGSAERTLPCASTLIMVPRG